MAETVCKAKSPETETVPETETRNQEVPVILCRNCDGVVTFPEFQVERDQGFVHTFANPLGHVFEIGCFSEAEGCVKASGLSEEFSWFKGYGWAVGICRQCQIQLGWIYYSKEDRFFGLILDQLIFPPDI